MSSTHPDFVDLDATSMSDADMLRHLAQADIALDQHQQAEFARRQGLAGAAERGGEVGKHRRLRSPQLITQQRRQQAAIEAS